MFLTFEVDPVRLESTIRDEEDAGDPSPATTQPMKDIFRIVAIDVKILKIEQSSKWKRRRGILPVKLLVCRDWICLERLWIRVRWFNKGLGPLETGAFFAWERSPQDELWGTAGSFGGTQRRCGGIGDGDFRRGLASTGDFLTFTGLARVFSVVSAAFCRSAFSFDWWMDILVLARGTLPFCFFVRVFVVDCWCFWRAVSFPADVDWQFRRDSFESKPRLKQSLTSRVHLPCTVSMFRRSAAHWSKSLLVR